MPVYEYRCGDCGAREEHTHSMTQLYNPKCEKCGRWMRMVYTPAAIVFTGKGWAKKDRAKKEGK
ncbi:CxxC_CxxC_SSSS, putative regulatory protein, FmdB family [uncultured Caudovirales phage]|jgi:putative FmdB family regulatory protein|uniref:CxxC_CxxC_SSSS, putative regulatory protein, FmdB family n=1 Tax=uncultured Caudovirales phage TaxID=2100421 RepID=A0A6J5MEI7_9CAUD|nr:CxxC_CxxC_SSSS, putative regulatory protein, FmdB family [uncultured Caudovirales phage]CAB4189259.1 CxxC_CxxC_SSSS, putative regulatory protein, FmdB family [uncultured Caudovirales phage]